MKAPHTYEEEIFLEAVKNGLTFHRNTFSDTRSDYGSVKSAAATFARKCYNAGILPEKDAARSSEVKRLLADKAKEEKDRLERELRRLELEDRVLAAKEKAGPGEDLSFFDQVKEVVSSLDDVSVITPGEIIERAKAIIPTALDGHLEEIARFIYDRRDEFGVDFRPDEADVKRFGNSVRNLNIRTTGKAYKVALERYGWKGRLIMDAVKSREVEFGLNLI